jgi:flavin reductase (DIM6/NTAB) family NADH-FMN oxidoreductase RutF
MRLGDTKTPPSAPSALASHASGDELRHAVGHFATGVAVVTSRDASGAPMGTTANAVTSLSLDPPLILVCFDRGSLTLAAIREYGAFAVNVLAAGQRALSTAFARRGSAEVWEGVEPRHGATGSPRLPDVIAVLDCTVEERLPGGDHEIVVGRVIDVDAGAPDPEPLVYYRGAYASLATP